MREVKVGQRYFYSLAINHLFSFCRSLYNGGVRKGGYSKPLAFTKKPIAMAAAAILLDPRLCLF